MQAGEQDVVHGVLHEWRLMQSVNTSVEREFYSVQNPACALSTQPISECGALESCDVCALLGCRLASRMWFMAYFMRQDDPEGIGEGGYCLTQLARCVHDVVHS